MAQWIALDDNTRQALRDALGPDGKISSRTGSAIKVALESHEDCAVVVPSGGPAMAQLLTFRKARTAEFDIPLHIAPEPTTAQAEVPPPQPVALFEAPENTHPGTVENTAVEERPAHEEKRHYEATGFLGLTDEPVYDDEPEQPAKKAWWQKLVK